MVGKRAALNSKQEQYGEKASGEILVPGCKLARNRGPPGPAFASPFAPGSGPKSAARCPAKTPGPNRRSGLNFAIAKIGATMKPRAVMIGSALRHGHLRWAAVWVLLAIFLARPDSLPGESSAVPANDGQASRAGSADARGLAPDAARRRIGALRAEIAHHDVLYFQQAEPEISDFAYDQLKRELGELEKAFPEAGGNFPDAAPVGDDRSGLFPTWRHRERMLSLEKTYAEAELRAFTAGLARQLGRTDLTYVVEPKIDGLAVSAIYEKGRFARAVTRGNGVEGDDITPNALKIRSLPRALSPIAPDGTPNPIPDLIELRGEIYVTFAEFERLNREREGADEPLFAHPRNLAASTVRLLDPGEVAERNLDVVFYGWGACEPAMMAPATQHGFHEQARAWGLPVLEIYWTVTGADGVWKAVQAFGRRRRQLAYPADGAVVKLDSVPLRRAFGETEHAPRWAMAYKYAPDRVETQLRAITVQVGRTGLLTPVAELAPVQLAGSAVARATLHNRQVIARLDIRVGDIVQVEKAGEIIPAITGVDLTKRPADSQPYVFPTVCPACGTAVVQLAGEVAVRCPNAACPAQVRQRLRHFASKSCVNVDGLGPAAIDRLVASGRVRNLPDLYRLRREDLVTSGHDREKSADRLLTALERSKQAELWRFIYGLSIPHVGAATAVALARQFGSLEALAAAGREDFAPGSRGEDAGRNDAAINAVLAYFSVPQNRAMVADLVALGVRPVAAPREANTKATRPNGRAD